MLEQLTAKNIVRNFDAREDARIGLLPGDWSTITGSYDLILTSETTYNETAIRSLVDLIARTLSRAPHSRALVCSKRYYFGVGGGTDDFLDAVAAHAPLCARTVASTKDNSVVRDIIEIEYVR